MDHKEMLADVRSTGMTQAEVAKVLGVTQATISKIERGVTRNLYADAYMRLLRLHASQGFKSCSIVASGQRATQEA